MGLNWYAVLYGDADGYGASADLQIEELDRRGIDVRCEPGWGLSSPNTRIRHVLQKPFVVGDVRVIYAPPDWKIPWGRSHPNQTVIGSTMWEDSLVPTSWIPSLARVDAVVAPSTFCADLFRPYAKRVYTVPLGVDGDFYLYRPRSKDNGPFTFLHTATGMDDPRKGARLAVEAFRRTFALNENVRLVLRAKHGDIPTGEDPRIHKMVRYITEEEKRQLLYGVHCYVYPSLGEGFGLMPLEAVATGLPAICSANTSMLDYQHLFYPVPCHAVASGQSTPTVRSSTGYWMEPNIDQLGAQIRWVYENYATATADAARRAAEVRVFSYARTVDLLLAAIEETRMQRAA